MDNLTEDEFNKDTLIQDAIFRRLEIIGEAVKNIPKRNKRRKSMEKGCRNERRSYTNIQVLN